MMRACDLPPIALVVLAAAAPALSEPAVPSPMGTAVSEVVVIAPYLGAGLARDEAPLETIALDSADVSRTGAPDVLRALDEKVGGITLDSASGNPFQPNLFYHGFEVSPLQGTPQGLAVYMNGVRFNQPFGDTVNWDLLPGDAIDRITVEGSNPVFGLNALGGALNVRLKTGFGAEGGDAALSGGSFGQARADAEYGRRFGNFAVYGAIGVLHQDGWRDLQSSDIDNAYGDLGWRSGPLELHLNATLARSDLNGPGASPVQLLAVDPAAQFTAPNAIRNRYAAASLTGDVKLGPRASGRLVLYWNNFRQDVANGNSPNDAPCDDGSGLLCSDTGPSTTRGGAPIPAFLGPNAYAYSELDTQTTNTNGYGASAQFAATGALFGRDNRVVAGFSFDGADTGFNGASYIGGLTPVARVYVGPGVLIDEPGENAPVAVRVRNADYGVFAADTFSPTRRLSLTVSGRWNDAEIDLHDQRGGDLTGDHSYVRFNPAAGLTFRARPWLTLYGGYAEASRAPTPAELSCAGPNDSCSLANFFVGDPNLKQVVAHTVEAGVRGALSPAPDARLDYSLALYRTDLDDDIAFINSPTVGRAYFANIGRTRRQGFDVDLDVTTRRWTAWAAYARIDATYQSGFEEAGGENPGADADGNLTIRPGDRLAGIPASQGKLGFVFKASERLTLGATAIARSGTYLFGDEANLTPKLPGFAVLNLDASYRLSGRLQVFARVDNVTDQRYATFGTFSPTSSVDLAQAPGASNPRSYSPAAPIGGFGGLRISF